MPVTCDHVWLPRDEGGVFCPECGDHRTERPPCWEEGRAPSQKNDIKPHFNFSAGRNFGSRREMNDYCKRNEVSVVPPEMANPDNAWAEADRCRENGRKKILAAATRNGGLGRVVEEEQTVSLG